MCECNLCQSIHLITKLNIKEKHPEQYQLIETSHIASESLNTDVSILIYLCNLYLDKESAKIPHQILNKDAFSDALSSSVSKVNELATKLREVVCDTSIPSQVSLAVHYFAISVETEIEGANNVLQALMDSKTHHEAINNIAKAAKLKKADNKQIKAAVAKCLSE